MAVWTWWRDDVLADLVPLPGLTVGTMDDRDTVAGITKLEVDEVVSRLAAGHQFYLAYIDGVPAASGWVAAFSASIGELGLAFAVPSHDRYLWDFVTLPAWRGHGIYPRLLQAILGAEAAHAGRFWIITAPENVASARGIAKAGFQEVSDLAFTPDHRPSAVIVDAQRQARARIGAALLGVPLLEAVGDGRVLSPCWRCVLAEERIGAACWPYEHGIAVNCTCS